MIESKSASHYDVIIIGAGINGAGIARDASLRGLQVLLLEKEDVASGTSSLSTRLIHGGLRYLEHGELSLVRESLREREILLKIAPHLIRPLPIVVPIYSGMRRGRAQIRAGMIAYDLLSLDKSLPRHQMLSATETLQQIPALKRDGLLGAAVYYDAQVEFAERLVLENVLDACENQATVITHASVENFEIQDDRVIAVHYRLKQSDKLQAAYASFVVNAAGPWIDLVLGQAGAVQSSLLGGTKGSHIVVSPFVGTNSLAVYVEAETDGRPFFVIPWNGNYLIGTTDVRFEEDPDEVRSELWEIDYLLRETNRIFPGANLTPKNVLYTYSGVRPLPFTRHRRESGITRRHFIEEHRRLKNLVSIVGGKLTTYRSLAEECVDLIFRNLGRRSPECTTAELPLPGGHGFKRFADDFENQTRLPAIARQRLLRIYGSRAAEVVQFCSANAGLLDYLDQAGSTLKGEIVFAFEREFAQTLTDCLMRRTMLGLNGGLAELEATTAAKVGQRFLSWTEQRAADELHDFRMFTGRRRLEELNLKC